MNVTGAVNFRCGRRIRYDDSDPEHRALRLTVPRPLLTCPDHGPEAATTAVSGPIAALIPDRAERLSFRLEVGQARYNEGHAA